MKKGIVVFLIILFTLNVLLSLFFPVDIRGKLTWNIVLIISSGLLLVALIGYLKSKYPKEHAEAERISNTPHNEYGWYALLFFALIFVLFYLYVFLSK